MTNLNVLVSRHALLAAVVVGTVLGCSTKSVVFDPGSTSPPNEPSSLPVFNGAAHQAETPPLPIAGGTLLTVVRPNGSAIALASDPDDDSVHVVSLGDAPAPLGKLQLQPGDEPGRLVADAGGRVHVVLRGSGSIATLIPTPTGASLVMRRSVCAAPRGIDYEPTTDSIYVACATGELVTMPASGGAATVLKQLDRDLRDVVIDGQNLYITRFRSAEILSLNLQGELANRTLPVLPSNVQSAAQPDVAWRALRNPNGHGVRVVYQVASTAPIDVAQPPGVSSYGGAPEDTNQGNAAAGVVSVAVASFAGSDSMEAAGVVANPVVDLAVSPSGAPETIGIKGLIESGSDQFQLPFDDGATSGTPDAFVAISDARNASTPVIVAQRRGVKPALVILRVDPNATLGTGSVLAEVALEQNKTHIDTGFDVFHVPTSAGIACMNCHPEGGDDSHTWTFQLQEGDRVRRTQSLRGGVISNSAPYHWDGDMTDLQKLCDEVFTHRMGGGAIVPGTQMPALARFVEAMPRVPVRTTLDQTRVAKGQALFQGAGACTSCHTSSRSSLASNQNIGKIDTLGSSAPLQVPMLLGVADRAPYMHDGCAPTLLSRFTDTKCAGSAHGNTSQMTDDDKQNLVEYLESL